MGVTGPQLSGRPSRRILGRAGGHPGEEPHLSGPGFWDRLAPAWEAWHASHAALTAPVTQALIGASGVGPGDRVLDLASGVGDPALALGARVGDTGAVVGTDASGAMLEAAARLAHVAGRSNVTWRQVGDGPLPFGDGTFDAVTCRFGLTFLPHDTLREARRVLHPGGRLAVAVWGEPSQPYFDEFDGVVARRFGWPPPRAGEPGLFRYAEPEVLGGALAGAGFGEVRVETRRAALLWPGTPGDYLACRLAFAPQVAGIVGARPPAERASLAETWRQRAAQRAAPGGLRFEGVFVLARGTR